MAESIETWRLFVAIYPPPGISLAMLEEAKRLRVPGRAVSAEQVHLTVLFMGGRPSADVPALERAFQDAVSGTGPVTLTPRELITLPPRRPRLLALECEATSNLHGLYTRLVGALTSPGDRGVRELLLPHFTLKRFARDDRVRPAHAPVRLGPFDCREIVLVRSLLGRGEGGTAVHTPVATAPLG